MLLRTYLEPALHTHRNIEDDFTIIGDLEEPKPQKVSHFLMI